MVWLPLGPPVCPSPASSLGRSLLCSQRPNSSCDDVCASLAQCCLDLPPQEQLPACYWYLPTERTWRKCAMRRLVAQGICSHMNWLRPSSVSTVRNTHDQWETESQSNRLLLATFLWVQNTQIRLRGLIWGTKIYCICPYSGAPTRPASCSRCGSAPVW